MQHLRSETVKPRSVRRSVLTRALAVLIGAGAFLVVTPGAAQAGTNTCPYTNFCIWQHINYDGGRYNWSGNDANLYNDYYVGTRAVVANSGSAVRNNGSAGGYDDVRAYYNSNYGNPSICFRQGSSHPDLRRYSTGLGSTWNDNIASFKWVVSC